MSEIVSVNIAGWLACLAFVLMVLNHGAKVVDRLKGRPTAQEVKDQVGAAYMTTESCHTLHGEHERRLAGLESAMAEMARSASESRKAMYAKMDAMGAAMAQDIRGVHARVDLLNAEVRAVPTTVVRLISESKQI